LTEIGSRNRTRGTARPAPDPRYSNLKAYSLQQDAMKFHHAAALALVGWYLMVPPLFKHGVNVNAPVSEWDHRQAFDTADACEKARVGLYHCGAVLNGAERGTVMQACGFDSHPRPIKDKKADAIVGQIVMQFYEAACIATDDPGLKGN